MSYRQYQPFCKIIILDVGKEIYWFYPYCNTEGVISDWQKTKWDNL